STSLDEIKSWIAGRNNRSDKPETGRVTGFIALLSGEERMGKRLIGQELSEYSGMDIQYIDLAPLSSKYIGETEKNLDKIFTAAAEKETILFFDEADALFGRRTEVKDSHDKYANQEVSYLLEKVSKYPGLVILSVSGKGNVDDA